MRRQQQDAVADDERFLDRVRDEQQREARVVPQPQQLFLHLAARQRIERGERLVHQQHARLHRERARNGDALLHAARQRMRIRIGERAEPHLVEIVQRTFARFGTRQLRGDAQRKRDVLHDGLPRRQLIELLKHDHAIRARPVHRRTVERDRAGDRFDEAGDRLQQRRFPAAGRAEQHEAVAAVHVEADLLRRTHDARAGAVLERHAVDREQTCAVRGGRRGLRRRAMGVTRRGRRRARIGRRAIARRERRQPGAGRRGIHDRSSRG
ncbi:hypothetical protein HMPREF3115_15030 [Burkholderia sp. HMSC10F09]|nr:hypothetical protein HMPREF3115_15030 [Burkholderia sp. HMSC10F09]